MSERLETGQHAVKRARGGAGDALSGLVVEILSLGAALEAAGNALARPAGQTAARWQVLAAIEHAPATVAQAARLLGLARQSVQRLADVLVADGLAAYADNPAHQRAKLLVLSPDGRAALRTIQAAQAEWARTLAEGLDADELDAARVTLAELGRRLGAG